MVADNFQTCPICQRQVPTELITSHAATCSAEGEWHSAEASNTPSKTIRPKKQRKKSRKKSAVSVLEKPDVSSPQASDHCVGGGFAALLNPNYREEKLLKNGKRKSTESLQQHGQDKQDSAEHEDGTDEDDTVEDDEDPPIHVTVRRMSTEHSILKGPSSSLDNRHKPRSVTVKFDDHPHVHIYNPTSKLKLRNIPLSQLLPSLKEVRPVTPNASAVLRHAPETLSSEQPSEQTQTPSLFLSPPTLGALSFIVFVFSLLLVMTPSDANMKQQVHHFLKYTSSFVK
eukprot:TRINITY_DN24016_c0_g1_i1.p1 TRINITY_DN24016_c0_g1~~TRINITY_DN24016_c0_g1_i1.p1  ORF type:complete len:285 (+),score=50.91 TRINITY_DN24016_c0_g1_i1:106-960(+)